jgi:hypothetical protein
MAKYVIMYTCAVLAYEFDFETKGIVDINRLDESRYGLGVVRPKAPVPVSMRRNGKKLGF